MDSQPIVRQPIRVDELIRKLSEYPEHIYVIASYDCGCAYGDVVGVAKSSEYEPDEVVVLTVD